MPDLQSNQDGTIVEGSRSQGEGPAGGPGGAAGDEGGGSGAADAPFRFRLQGEGEARVESLEAFYRDSIRDLLSVVRFHLRGKPVIVDSFAFADRPNQLIQIMETEDGCELGGGRAVDQ